MDVDRLENAAKEAQRFLGKVRELRDNALHYSQSLGEQYIDPGKHTGAVKRASLDLTRALAELRKPDTWSR